MPILNDFERRTLANLSIPRNVEDLTAHLRPNIVRDPGDVHAMLDALAKEGWVKKLGEFDPSDPAKLVAKAQTDKGTMEIPDEKAEILARRLGQYRHLWRMSGDLWMLTSDGVDKLHEPTVDSPTSLPPSQVQAIVDAEWARTLAGVDHDQYNAKHAGADKPDGPSLVNALLHDEFNRWFADVADACEKTWNVRPTAPVGGGASGYSDAYEIALLDAENQKTALGAVVDPWYMTLSILAFTDADTGTTADDGTHKPTYTGYARKSVAGTDMAAGSGTSGSVSNTSAIIFAACTGGSSNIVACGNTSASTVGTLRKWGDTTGTVAVSTTATPPQFAVGAYSTATA